MDITLARTFLEIVSVGSFVGAAERLHVSQSTVSVRVKNIEEELGRPIFERRTDGVALTPAGEQFRRYAAVLVNTWEQAKLHVQVPSSFDAVVAIGGQHTLWEGLLLEWLGRMRRNSPGIAVRAELARPDELMRRLVEGTLDVAVMYTPELRPGLTVEPLLADCLVLATGGDGATSSENDEYLHVDWGAPLNSVHSELYSEQTPPGIYVTQAGLALDYLLAHGGRAYLPVRLVRPHVTTGRLRVVPDTPILEHQAYAVFSKSDLRPEVAAGLEVLRSTAEGIATRVD